MTTTCRTRDRRVTLNRPVTLGSGAVLERCTVGLRLHGDSDAPAVVVLGGISAGRVLARLPNGPDEVHCRPGRDAAGRSTQGGSTAGWWDGFVGPGKAVDTDRFVAVGFDWLGGRGWTSGPGRPPAEPGLGGWPGAGGSPNGSRPVTVAAFPAISTRDQAAVLLAALEQVGVGRVAAVVGSSYGGMVGLALADLAPDRLDRLVVISGAHRSHPMATGLRSLQRRVIALARESGQDAEGLSIARGIAMTTYRTAREFEERFPGPAEVCGYLEARGKTFSEEWPVESYLCLSESLDRHEVDPAKLGTPLTLIGITSDTLVPPWQIRALARRYAGPVALHWLASRYGHDAFLKETRALGTLIRGALSEAAP